MCGVMPGLCVCLLFARPVVGTSPSVYIFSKNLYKVKLCNKSKIKCKNAMKWGSNLWSCERTVGAQPFGHACLDNRASNSYMQIQLKIVGFHCEYWNQELSPQTRFSGFTLYLNLKNPWKPRNGDVQSYW